MCPSAYDIGARAVHRWRTATAVGGVGATQGPIGHRFLDALRCILSLIWEPNEWFEMKNTSVLRNQFTFVPPFCVCKSVCRGPTAIAAGAHGLQKPEGSRCSEMNYQPYLSPKWVIPDEKYSCFEKANLPFFCPFLVCKSVCLGSTAIGAGVWGVAQGHQKPKGSRWSEMHSQPYLSTPTFLYINVLWPHIIAFLSACCCTCITEY